MHVYIYTRVRVLVHARVRHRVRNDMCVRIGVRVRDFMYMGGWIDGWIYMDKLCFNQIEFIMRRRAGSRWGESDRFITGALELTLK